MRRRVSPYVKVGPLSHGRDRRFGMVEHVDLLDVGLRLRQDVGNRQTNVGEANRLRFRRFEAFMQKMESPGPSEVDTACQIDDDLRESVRDGELYDLI